MREHWRRFPDAGVGIACGPDSDLWVLDVDGAEGLRQLDDLQTLYGQIPPTWTVQTGSGGQQLYFRWPQGARKPTNRAKLVKAGGTGAGQGLDARGDGGQVVAPPSSNRNGAYRVLCEADPIYAPEWLDTAALLGTRPRACRAYRAKTKGKVERMIRELKEDFLAWLAGQPFPERPTLAWYDERARHWTITVVTRRRHRTTRRIVGEAWAEERPLLTPVSRRLLARLDGVATLVPVPAPVGTSRAAAALGETVEVRPLAAYGELVR